MVVLDRRVLSTDTRSVCGLYPSLLPEVGAGVPERMVSCAGLHENVHPTLMSDSEQVRSWDGDLTLLS